MALELKNTQQLIDDLTLAILQQGGPLVDFSQGSNLYTLVRAVALVLGISYKNVQEGIVNSFISTASGSALEAHAASFGVYKKQGTLSSGNVVALPRNSGATPVVLASPMVLTTVDGKYEYVVNGSTIVVAPSTLVPITARSIGGEYDLPAGTPLVLAGNDATNAGWKFVVATDGLDVDGNPTGFLRGGSSAETDVELRTRFVEFINSLSRSTFRAVKQAISGVPDVQSFVMKEHMPATGWFTVFIDDGTDNPPRSLIDLVAATLDSSKALGIAYDIQAMPKRVVNVTVAVKIDPTYPPATIEAMCEDKIIRHMQGMQFGQSLYLPKLAALCYEIPGVLKPNIMLPTTDVLVEAQEIIRPGVIDVIAVL